MTGQGWEKVESAPGGGEIVEWVEYERNGETRRGVRIGPGLDSEGKREARINYRLPIEPISGRIRVSVDLRPDSHGSVFSLASMRPFGDRLSVYFRNGGLIRVYNGGIKEGQYVDLPPYELGRWYRLELDIEIDSTGRKKAIYSVNITDLDSGHPLGMARGLAFFGNPRFLDQVVIGAVNSVNARTVWDNLVIEVVESAQAEPLDIWPVPGEVLPRVYGKNYLPNGGFEDGLAHWKIYGENGAEWESEIVQGERGPELVIRKLNDRGTVVLLSDPFQVESGKGYEFTGLYQTSDAKFSNFGEWMLQSAPRKEALLQKPVKTSVSAGHGAHTGMMMIYNSEEGDWRRKTRDITIPASHDWARMAFVLDGPPIELKLANNFLIQPEPDTRQPRPLELEKELPMDVTLERLMQRPDSTAEVVQRGDGPLLLVDGKPHVPFVQMADVVYPRRGYIRDFAEHGIDLHFVTIYNKTQKHWTGVGKYDLKKVDEIIWNSVRRHPEGNFIVYINVSSYDDWFKDFPEASAMNRAGEYVVSRHNDHAPASYWSDEYRRQVVELVETYVRHIRQQPYARAIVGYYIGGGEDGQFYYQGVKGQKTIQDGQSPGDLPYFRRWLEEYYKGDVEALRKAWGDPELEFSTAMPPVENERYPGVFLDPVKNRPIYDFFRFLNDGVATLLTDAAKAIKREAGKPVIVGAYYGRGAMQMVYPHFSQNNVMFKEKAIDFMGAQGGYYGWREVGSSGVLNWVYDSLRRNGILPMMELDFRTWFGGFRSLTHDFKVARFWNLNDFKNAVARDGGKMLSVGGGLWWMEMSGGWFRDDAIMAFLQEFNDTANRLYAEPVVYTPAKIVMISDESNYLWTTEQVNIWNGPNYHTHAVQQRALYLAGVRLDFYYLDDLIGERPEHYDVYYFKNAFHPTSELIEWVKSLRQKGKTIIWQYAPGWLTEDGFSTESMAELTGFTFRHDGVIGDGIRSYFVEQSDNPDVAALIADQEGDMMGIGVDLPADRFVVTGGYDAVLARYEANGEPAAAVRRDPESGSLSIILGHPSAMTPQLMANIAALSGVHRYVLPGDMFFYKRDDLIVMHGIEGGKQRLTLPESRTIRELIHGKIGADNVSELEFELKPGETIWLHLTKPEASKSEVGLGGASFSGRRLTIETGDYKAEFRPESAWTFGKVFYQGKPIISETGANQTVINVRRGKDDSVQDPWIGTGHGGEKIRSVQLEVDGRLFPLDSNLEAVQGRVFRVIKEADIGPFRLNSTVTVSPEGIEQDYAFRVLSDASSVNYMYAFMHCFNGFMSRWIADTGEDDWIRGEFYEDNSMTLKRDIRALAVYSEAEQVGAVLVYPEVYPGKPERANQLWNRPHDNKHYLCIDPPVDPGARFRLRAKLTGFSAASADWEQAAIRQIAQAVFSGMP